VHASLSDYHNNSVGGEVIVSHGRADNEWLILADPNPDDEPPADDTEPTGETVIDTEPSDDEPADQPFPTYQSKQPDQPPSLASQVESIAGTTSLYLAVLGLISAAILFFLPISSYVLQITVIVLVVGVMLCAIVAAVAEHFVNRHKTTDTEPRRAR
jgi:hypothetical protein